MVYLSHIKFNILCMRKPLLFLTALSLLSSLSFAQSISLLAGSSYTQNFDGLANSGTTNDQSTLPLGWYMLETGTNANTTYAADNGSSNAGNTYSYGSTGSTDRALGGLLSGNLIPLFGASFTNNTGITLTSITISYTGELWRLGTTGRTDQLDFSLSLDATSLTTGNWPDINNLDFVTPNITGTAGARDGNAAGNRTAISFTITGLSIPNGATFWIRWSDFNATSADDGLAVDDFTLSTNASILPVKLTDFSVTRQQQAVVASWATLTETNSKQFELQRNVAGSSWTTVATVAAQGNSNSRREYKALDAQPLAGTVLYRIKSIDLDGSFTYSSVQQLTVQAAALQAKLYPNPASQQVFVQLTDASTFKGWLQISNNNGQVLLRRQVSSSNGQLQVPIQQLTAGMYSVQLVEEASGKKQTLSLIVK